MKKVLCTLAVAALLLVACNGKAKKAAAAAAEAAEIQRVDSVTMVMENLKGQIDFTVQEVDSLMNQL
jgi:ABC-type glycerol-3-phosphate transport system substrate-binding protein